MTPSWKLPHSLFYPLYSHSQNSLIEIVDSSVFFLRSIPPFLPPPLFLLRQPFPPFHDHSLTQYGLALRESYRG